MNEAKPYGTILADAAKRNGIATAALALSIAALASNGDGTSTSKPAKAEQLATPPTAGVAAPRATKRLEVSTDVEVAPGASITAAGEVELGSRIASIDGCVGRYDEVTGVCVLSPGPWELHTGCSELTGDTTTRCTVVVKNTGSTPLKFSGYIQVAIKGTPEP